MTGITPGSSHLYLAATMESAVIEELSGRTIGVFSRPCPGKDTPNEDGAAIIALGGDSVVLAVADGVGGARGGDQASRLALETVSEQALATVSSGTALREGVLRGFEIANEAILGLGIGAATTLAVVTIESGHFRSYHAGDSEIWVVGQRGKIKHQSVSHSPVGYGVESGLIDEEDAMTHEERHVVSNLVGDVDMKIDVSPSFQLAPRDTVVMGSDGLFDNLRSSEILREARAGPLLDKIGVLVSACDARMAGRDGPSKPDDLTFILCRGRSRRGAASDLR